MPLYGQRGYGSGKYGIADEGALYKQPLGYYLNLFTSQYKLSQKFLTWAQRCWQPVDDLTNLLSFISSNYDLDYAVGKQLDVCGLLLGQSRTLGFQPSNSVSPVLDDNTYRLLLKAKRVRNSWSGKTVDLYAAWQSLFPGGRIIINDNQNMTATIFVTGSFNSIILDLINNGYIVPRPEGVLYNYVTGNLPIFGADENNTYIAGADLGHAS